MILLKKTNKQTSVKNVTCKTYGEVQGRITLKRYILLFELGACCQAICVRDILLIVVTRSASNQNLEPCRKEPRDGFAPMHPTGPLVYAYPSTDFRSAFSHFSCWQPNGFLKGSQQNAFLFCFCCCVSRQPGLTPTLYFVLFFLLSVYICTSVLENEKRQWKMGIFLWS